MSTPAKKQYHFWFEKPAALVDPKILESLAGWWPLAKANKDSPALRCNAMTRLLVAITLVAFFVSGFDLRTVIVGIVAVAISSLVYYSGEEKKLKETKEALLKSPELFDLGKTESHSPFGGEAFHRDRWEFIPTPLNPTPDLLPPSAKCPDQDENPYCNPMPYQAPGAEVRCRRSTYEPAPEPWLDKLYRGSNDTPMDLYANRLPDPTLMARPVFWNFDPRPDIVSHQARVADRWMTY